MTFEDLLLFRDERKHIKVPWNIEDAKNLGIVLSRYKLDHYYHVMSGVFLTYILYPLANCSMKIPFADIKLFLNFNTLQLADFCNSRIIIPVDFIGLFIPILHGADFGLHLLNAGGNFVLSTVSIVREKTCAKGTALRLIKYVIKIDPCSIFRRKPANGVSKCTSTKTTYLITWCFSELPPFCQIGLSIWPLQFLGCL